MLSRRADDGAWVTVWDFLLPLTFIQFVWGIGLRLDAIRQLRLLLRSLFRQVQLLFAVWKFQFFLAWHKALRKIQVSLAILIAVGRDAFNFFDFRQTFVLIELIHGLEPLFRIVDILLVVSTGKLFWILLLTICFQGGQRGYCAYLATVLAAPWILS